MREDDMQRLMRKFGWTRRKATSRLALVEQAEQKLACTHGMPAGCCAICEGERKTAQEPPGSTRLFMEDGNVS